MKFFILMSFLSSALFAETSQNTTSEKKKISSPPNAVSRGQSESAGISESPTGTTRQEAQEYRTRSESMGGAPNAGGGMGTGTGAGSTVGQELDEED